MKKTIVFVCVLSILLTSAAFAGGGRRADTMRFAWWGNPARNLQTTEVLELFTEQTGISVDPVTGTFGEYWTMIDSMALAGNLPDVMQHNIPQLLARVPHLVDLRPFMADHRIDVRNLPEAVLQQARVGEGIYGIPMGMNVSAIVYDRSFLDSLGLSAPRNMTLDQFVALAREIYARTGVRTNWTSNAPYNPLRVHLRAQGVEMFEYVGGRWRMGGQPVHYQAFFDFVAQGIQEGWHSRLEDWGGRDRFAMATNPLVYPPDITANPNLRSWITFAWSNQIIAFQAQAGTAQLNLTTPPSINPQMSNHGRAAMLISMTRDARDRDAAAQMINFWVNNQAVHSIVRLERGGFVNSVIADAINPLLNPIEQMQAEFTAWVNRPENSSPFIALEPEGTLQFYAELNLVTDMVLAGTIAPAVAAQRVFDFGNSVIR
ncbi:MAG: ABC transporter substrate-binding protein [Treponema sp.]|nr:ABC transporter substrate-binding protein [Treponema sp.]